MKFKDLFPSATVTHGILFVRIADVLDGREYIDSKNLASFERGLRAIGETRYANAALSFRGLSFLSGRAMDILVEFHRFLERGSRRLLVYELHPKVKVVFEELGMDRYFDVYGLEGHILHYFKPDGPGARS